MASLKVEICLKKKTHPEHKYAVTFDTKVGTVIYLQHKLLDIGFWENKQPKQTNDSSAVGP